MNSTIQKDYGTPLKNAKGRRTKECRTNTRRQNNERSIVIHGNNTKRQHQEGNNEERNTSITVDRREVDIPLPI